MRQQTKIHLQHLQQVMQKLELWQAVAPPESAFLSNQPFALDTLEAHEWLQWVFIPRMYALLESDMPLPQQIAVVPYVEEALKELDGLDELLSPISAIEQLCKNQ
ncbi:YqcC family protein [Necropsobacter massiliensis]|uniref:YqcC family protein n=1 Tax=Necropsobacter massiliensis TaxID=1400001 RepID=UPI0005963D13|nr:YqcC family protein [Necropsobacter massiliensis]